MAADDSLKLILAANAEIAEFLETAPAFSCRDAGPALSLPRVQEQVATLMLTIQNVGRCVRSAQSSGLDADARAAIDLYAHNLGRFKQFLNSLRSHAEARRHQLLVQSRKINDVLAWCVAVKLSNLE